MHSNGRLPVVLVAISGLLVGAAIGSLLSGTDQNSSGGTSGLAVDTEPIERELRSIREALDDLARREAVARERDQPVMPIDKSPSVDLGASLEALAAAIEGLNSRTEGPVHLATRPSRQLNKEVLHSVWESIEPSTPAVPPALFGLSPAGLYQHLGTPSEVKMYSDATHWVYRDGSTALEVQFVDGYVARARRSSE